MIGQSQVQKQQLKILPQQIQLLNLYFLNSLELEQRIQKEMEENPLLEAAESNEHEDTQLTEEQNDFKEWEAEHNEDIPDYKQEYGNYLNEEDMPHVPLKAVENFKDDAKKQIGFLDLNNADRQLGMYIIDSLTHRGILDKEAEELAEDYSFATGQLVDPDDVERVLKIIQTLDPVGLGARSIQECLMIQFRKIQKRDSLTALAMKLVDKHYNDLMHRQFERIQNALHVSDEQLKQVLGVIGGLKFYPVAESEEGTQPINTIIPDFIVRLENNKLRVALYSSRSDNVFVNQSLFEEWQKECKGGDRSASTYIKNKLQSAQWFVNAVKQREETMLSIMKCIVMLQQAYFMEGDIRLLKPMVLRNISDLTGYDISTVSRITGNKYAETHFGIIFLKKLFSEGIANEKGKVISSKVIQSVIAEAIENEDSSKPYTDQQLVKILADKGYKIARRTIAKYREAMQIPIAQIRAIVK